MKIPLSILLFCLASSAHAQVRELWRTGLTNGYLLCHTTNGTVGGGCGFPTVDYLTTTAAIDRNGNTLVGGISTGNPNFLDRTSLVAKFDSRGNKSWEYNIRTKAYAGVEGLASDDDGNVFFTTRLMYEEPRPLLLIKLDPQGNELWRAVEFEVGMNSAPLSTIRVDSCGNVFLLTTTNSQNASGNYVWSYFLDKFSPDGKRLWQSVLPGDNYYLSGDFGFSKSLTLLADGGVAVVGMQLTEDGFQGVVAKIDASGKLQWLRHSDRKHFDSSGFYNVLPGPFGTILAGGSDSAAVYSSKGRLIRGITPGFGCDVLGVLPNKSFLVNQIDGASIVAYGPNGRERWRMNTSMFNQLGLILRDNHAIAVGHVTPYVDKLIFSCFDLQGGSLWQTELPGYLPHPNSDERMNSVLSAPDGTIRVVMNFSQKSAYQGAGIVVSSLSIDTPRPSREKVIPVARSSSF